MKKMLGLIGAMLVFSSSNFAAADTAVNCVNANYNIHLVGTIQDAAFSGSLPANLTLDIGWADLGQQESFDLKYLFVGAFDGEKNATTYINKGQYSGGDFEVSLSVDVNTGAVVSARAFNRPLDCRSGL